jgi:hypothetical protein
MFIGIKRNQIRNSATELVQQSLWPGTTPGVMWSYLSSQSLSHSVHTPVWQVGCLVHELTVCVSWDHWTSWCSYSMGIVHNSTVLFLPWGQLYFIGVSVWVQYMTRYTYSSLWRLFEDSSWEYSDNNWPLISFSTRLSFIVGIRVFSVGELTMVVRFDPGI